MFNGERLNSFSLKLIARKKYLLLAFLSIMVLDVLPSEIRENKENLKVVYIGKNRNNTP